MNPPLSFPIRTAICVGQWLPASETFIYDQLKFQTRTRARVIARDRTPHADRFPYDDVVHLGPLEQIAYYHFGVSGAVTQALKAHQTEVIHAHFGLNGTMVLGAARRLNLPLVVSLHGHDIGGLEPQNRHTVRYGRYQRLAPELFEYASRFLCASTELAQLLLEKGAPEEKVKVHHLGVDVDAFRPSLRKTREMRAGARVLMVGRLVEKKGIDDGLRAFARVADEFPDSEMVIVGDGPLRSQLRRLSEDLGLGTRVVFRGAVSSAEVLEEMQQAALLLTPSYTTASGDRESGVIVVKEAGAVGLCTVATRHGGIPEIVEDGHTGYLVPERDVHALADRMRRVLSSPGRSAEMGKSARARVIRLYDTRKQNEILEEELIFVSKARAGRLCA